MKKLIASYPVATFFLLAYLLSWSVTIPLAISGVYSAGGTASELLHSLGALGPALAAFLVVSTFSREKKRQFADNFRWHQTFRPMGILLISSPIWLFALAQIMYYGIFGDYFGWQDFRETFGIDSAGDVILYLLPLLAYGIFEEIGWRGFALPALQARMGAFAATLLLGLLWAGWHIPFFFYRFEMDATALVGFASALLLGAVLMTGIYNASGGSVFSVMIFHLLWNVLAPLDEQMATYISVGIMAMAMLVFIVWGYRELAPEHRIRKYSSQ